MSLEKLISDVPNWQNSTTEDIFTELNKKTIPYRDSRAYKLSMIATIVGTDAMKPLIAAAEAAGVGWVFEEAISGIVLSAEQANTALRVIDHPGAIKLADYVSRLVSPLESRGLRVDFDDVRLTVMSMKVSIRKSQLLDKIADDAKLKSELVTSWNGDPSTEPPV